MTIRMDVRLARNSKRASIFFVGALLACPVITGCLFSTRTVLPEIKTQTWHLQGIAHELGSLNAEGEVDFRSGDTTVFAGELVLRQHPQGEGLQDEQAELFPEGRECYYSVKWNGPSNCYVDDIWELSEDGRARLSFGSHLCDAAGPESLSGHWAMNSSQTELSLAFRGETAGFQYEELDGGLIKLSTTLVDTDICGRTVHVKTQFSFRAR